MDYKYFFILIFAEVSTDEMKREREEKKRYLLRKLSFRPSVDELKSRKVSQHFCFYTLPFPGIWHWNTEGMQKRDGSRL